MNKKGLIINSFLLLVFIYFTLRGCKEQPEQGDLKVMYSSGGSL
jgi:hypothetical protein